MNNRRYALAGSMAVLLLGAGALTLPAVAAPATAPAAAPGSAAAAAHSTTLRFHSINKAVTPLRGGGVQIDVDRALDGRVIGYDILDFVGGDTSTTTAWVTVGLRAGTMSGVLTIDDAGAATGRLTGGTGRFAGVRGTISAPAGNPELVTVKYHH